MAEHLHHSFIPGCFRCELSLDEDAGSEFVRISIKDLSTLLEAGRKYEALAAEVRAISRTAFEVLKGGVDDAPSAPYAKDYPLVAAALREGREEGR